MKWILMLAISCAYQGVAEQNSALPPTVESLVERWAMAAEATDQIDLRFDVRQYDETFNTVKVGKGRFYANNTDGGVISISPFTDKIVEIDDYTRRPWDAETLIYSSGETLDIRPAKMTALRARHPADLRQGENAPTSVLKKIADNIQAHWRSSPRIASSLFLDAELIRGIRNRTVLNVTESHGNLVLSGKVNDGALAKNLSSFKLMFDGVRPFPIAAQIVNPAGTERTVYIFQKPSSNKVPEDVNELLHPDLTGYRVHTIE